MTRNLDDLTPEEIEQVRRDILDIGQDYDLDFSEHLRLLSNLLCYEYARYIADNIDDEEHRMDLVLAFGTQQIQSVAQTLGLAVQTDPVPDVPPPAKPH